MQLMTNWYMTGIKVWKYYPSMKPTMGWSGCFQVRVFQKSIKNKNSSDQQSYVPWEILLVAMAWTWSRVAELGLEKPPYLYLLFIFLAASRRTYILYPCILPSLQRGLIHDIILWQSFLTVEASMVDRYKYTDIYWEGVHLTLPPHIFSKQVKFRACYITGQRRRVQNKIKET